MLGLRPRHWKTYRGGYAFRDEQGELLRAVVSALCAARGERWTLAQGCHPRSSGSTLERSEELAEAPREESERDSDRQCNRYVRWMLGGRCATTHGAGIDITSPRLKSA